MTSDDELLKVSLAGRNSPPFNSNNHDIGYNDDINITEVNLYFINMLKVCQSVNCKFKSSTT